MNVTLELPNMPDDVLGALRQRSVKEGKPIGDVALRILIKAIAPLNEPVGPIRKTHAKGGRK